MTAPPSQCSVEQAFALMLETACEDFENLQNLISGHLQVVASARDPAIPPNKDDPRQAVRAVRASARIQMALAKSFVFNAHRANRICDNNKAALALDRLERNRFLKATSALAVLRDVNEHGFDGGKDDVRPSLRFHPEAGWMDETALVPAGPDMILMGAVNLYPVYRAVDRMRMLARSKATQP